MFSGLRRLFTSKSQFISVTNLNDLYLQTSVDLTNSLGGNISLNSNRDRHTNRMFVLDFSGDVMATGAHGLAQEVTAILAFANTDDEVLIKIESPGGAVHSYGYASSQIARLKDAGISTVVSVDKVAASGGYMMACIGDTIISAPFAILGSIGVVAELPNFSRILDSIGVDYKQYTAGKFKRTISSMVPITKDGEDKFVEDLDKTYDLFKEHVLKYRPNLDIESIATGEHWYGSVAKELGLVDLICTSDEYILSKMNDTELIKISYIANKSWSEKMKGAIISITEALLIRGITLFSYSGILR